MNSQSIVINKTAFVMLRVTTSLIFVVAGSNHLFHTEVVVRRLAQAHLGFLGHLFGPPELLVISAGVLMLLAGFSLMIGYKVKLMSAVLLSILIPITITVQVGQVSTLGPLFKNISILGALAFLFINSSFKSINK